jgi:hypothetical protein
MFLDQTEQPGNVKILTVVGTPENVDNARRRIEDIRDVKLTVVFYYYELMETYSRILSLRGYGNLQSYFPSILLFDYRSIFSR